MRRLVGRVVIAIGVIVVAFVVTVRLGPLVSGPPLPTGATRLDLVTEQPSLTLGCADALLGPVRVEVVDGSVVLVATADGSVVEARWPSGYGAWSLDGRAEIADPWGAIVAHEGDVLDRLGGGWDASGRFHICASGIVPA